MFQNLADKNGKPDSEGRTHSKGYKPSVSRGKDYQVR